MGPTDALTVPNVMRAAAAEHRNKSCMGVRPILENVVETKTDAQGKEKQLQFWRKGPYQWRSYGEVYADISAASKGLYALKGVGEKRKQKQQVIAALLAETSQEWMIAAQAALGCGLTITTVYATLGHEAMLHGLNQTEAEVIFMDWGIYDKLKDTVLAKCPALRHIIFIGKDLVPATTSGGAAAIPSFPTIASLPGSIGDAR